ncbi:hypothetical protein, partial [Reichenbachiella sp.]
MKFSWRLILYFGFAGVAASIFLTLLRMINANFAYSFFAICGNFFVNALSAYVLTVLVCVVVMWSLIRINRILPWKE